MYKRFVLLAVIAGPLVPFELQAQNCGTAPPSPALYAHTRDVVAQIDVTGIRNAGTTCVPLQPHVVRLGDGTGGITQAQLNTALTFLNYFYLDAGIEFFWKAAPNFVNNTDYYTFNETAPDSDTEAGLAALFTTATDAVNIYFVNAATLTSGAICGYAYYPNNSVQANRVLMVNSCAISAPNGTFAHELGHYFNLFHTHEGTENGNAHANAENVPRAGGQANCNTKGDLHCDTQADPRYASGQFNLGTCTYTGGGTDINGVTYIPPVDNIMSYYPDQCGGLFTPDQLTRIAQGLVTRQGHSAYNLNAPPQVVTAPSGLTAVVAGSSVQLNWNDNAANDRGYLIERSTTSAASGFRQLLHGSTGLNGVSFTDTDVATGTTYWYRVKATNGNCNNYSNVAAVSTGLMYCIPVYSAGCSTSPIADFIFNGQASTISNINSGCSAAQHGDFTGMSANVNAGSAYTLTAHGVTTGFGTYSPRYIQIYGDWNQDGDFNDANETMLPANSAMAPTYTGPITIPAAALNGATRLRVRIWDQLNGCTQGPCLDCFAFGETEDYTLVVSGGVSAGVQLSAKIFLEGPYQSGPQLMTDGLRTAGHIPALEPYTAMGLSQVAGGGGETLGAGVLSVTGANAIVDWVRVELRSSVDPATVLATRQALVQRDGDVVSAMDGTSPLTFAVPAGNYHVAVRHRNHLGCMTAAAMAMSGTPVSVDLRQAATTTWGTDARRIAGAFMLLWSGNVVPDAQLKYTGSTNDRDPILIAVGGTVPTNTTTGYAAGDVNMDGIVKYTGSANDRDPILINIGGAVPTAIRQAQLP